MTTTIEIPASNKLVIPTSNRVVNFGARRGEDTFNEASDTDLDAHSLDLNKNGIGWVNDVTGIGGTPRVWEVEASSDSIRVKTGTAGFTFSYKDWGTTKQSALFCTHRLTATSGGIYGIALRLTDRNNFVCMTLNAASNQLELRSYVGGGAVVHGTPSPVAFPGGLQEDNRIYDIKCTNNDGTAVLTVTDRGTPSNTATLTATNINTIRASHFNTVDGDNWGFANLTASIQIRFDDVTVREGIF